MSSRQAELATLLNGYLKLEPADRRTFLRMLRAAGAQVGAEQEQEDESSEGLLYWSVRTVLLSLSGVQAPPFGVLNRETKQALRSAHAWLLNGKDLPRRTKISLFGLAAAAACYGWRSRLATYPTFSGGFAALLHSIPAAVEESYPGYQQAGLLLLLAQKIADGELPKPNPQPEEE